jgi:hypothetical protein
MAATWGSNVWGFQNWGTLGDNAISLSSANLLASFSLGTIVTDTEIQVGWGGDTWGENEWGDLSGSQPTVTGIQSTFSIGTLQSVSANATVDVTGTSLTSSIGTTIGGASVTVIVVGSLESMAIGSVATPIGQEIDVTGLQLSSTVGATTVDESTLTGIGWGRRTWGNLAWGGAYSAIAVGQQLTSTINFPSTGAFTDVNVSVTSVGQLTTTFASPSFSIQIDQDIFVLASEDQLDALTTVSTVTGDASVDVTGIQSTISQGNTVGGLKTPVDVTGIQATMTLGSINLIQSTNESVTGQQLAMTLGQHAEIPGQIIGVSGLSITSSLGEEGITGNGLVTLTGQSLTSSVGSPNITAWAEVNPGVANVWTEVDLAA